MRGCDQRTGLNTLSLLMTGSPCPSWIHLSHQKMLRGHVYPQPTTQAPTGMLPLLQDASERCTQCLVLSGHCLCHGAPPVASRTRYTWLFMSYTLQLHFLGHAGGRDGTTVEHLAYNVQARNLSTKSQRGSQFSITL